MRRHWIDNLRWVTVLLVLLYHVIYFYNDKGVFGGIGGFGGTQPQDAVMYILYPWFMMLLFLLAGTGSRYSLEQLSAGEFIKARTRKLLVPATIGLFVFQWIAGYFNIRIAGIAQGTGNPVADAPGFVRYIAMAFSGIGPLWFIQDLWLFSLLLIPIRLADRKDRLWSLCRNTSPVVAILLGVTVWLGAQTMVADPAPESAQGLWNLYRPVTYFIPFLLGYFVFSHDEVVERLSAMQVRIPLLAVAAISGIWLTVTTFGENNTEPRQLMGWLTNFYAWIAILALIGWFRACADRTGRFAGYMTRSSFGIYVVHYLIVASVGYWLKVYTTQPPVLMYLILFAAVFGLNPALYELVRRVPFVRWCALGITRPAGRRQ